MSPLGRPLGSQNSPVALPDGACAGAASAPIYVTLIEPPPLPLPHPPPPNQDDSDDSVYGFGAEWLLAIDYKQNYGHWRLNQNNNYVISVLKS
ncbi:Hypothetical protein NTJ_07766 [Nesidiocoris tenuis]|uniref:Uncharacterized protein n=1 Tax=Nesidiocoris tenuis TaxID=355587 RepID=A0ABN7AWV6_9HEMI|nr:Hypothetical protein NTJ_07766 [Nesidiocoris tenuis]